MPSCANSRSAPCCWRSFNLTIPTRSDKFHFVVEGQGEFVVGEKTIALAAGGVIWAPAGVPHGVTNRGAQRLVVLMGIAPRE
jgi:mannose-6-phosphate isomerase-like protein (cupin superfamily)